VPEQHRKVYFHWLENIEPWCISRQLWWGHQIPVWYGFDLAAHGFRDDEGDGALDEVEMLRLLNAQTLLEGEDRHHCAADFDAVAGQFADVLGRLPTPLNHARVVEVADRHAAAHALGACLAQYEIDQDPTKLVYPVWRDPDVLDTWFSSGLWPIGTLGWPEETEALKRYFPTSTLITRFRHHLLLGRPDDDDAAGRDRRGAVPGCLCPRARPGREGARRCPRASATCSTRWNWSTNTAPTRCASR
jgi:valyl-tRNA synthetase